MSNKIFGLPLVALITCLDTFMPESRRLFVQKQRSAEAIPFIVMSYLRLFNLTADPIYLEKSRLLLDWLIDVATPTTHGLGWGLHFNWQAEEYIPQGTPCVTLTAYSTSAFLEGYKLFKYNSYLDTALKTSEFVANDLHKRMEHDTISLSYTPIDHRFVINANSYAARILMETLDYQDNAQKRVLIKGILNYIVSQQNQDGSWYYHDKTEVPPNKNFIDSFHTCFILENLFFLWKWRQDQRIKRAILEGYDYFITHFIKDDHTVKLYHYYPLPTGVQVDIRACAEAIYCTALLDELIPGALKLSNQIAESTIGSMQHKAGYFYFRKYTSHTHKMPYMRWGEAPMFNALTFLHQKQVAKYSDEKADE